MGKKIVFAIWDMMLLWVLKCGTKIFKGPEGAYIGGTKTRRWLLLKWLTWHKAAVGDKYGKWDDSAVSWIRGFMGFTVTEEPNEN